MQYSNVSSTPETVLENELHALVQPLSSLQCRLEIGLLLKDEHAAREALREGLTEMKRVSAAIAKMREILRTTRDKGAVV